MSPGDPREELLVLPLPGQAERAHLVRHIYIYIYIYIYYMCVYTYIYIYIYIYRFSSLRGTTCLRLLVQCGLVYFLRHGLSNTASINCYVARHF